MRTDGSNGMCSPIEPSWHVPLEMVLLWSASLHNTANTVDSQNCWMWALVWDGPIKRLGFLSREECIVSHLCTADRWWSESRLSAAPLVLVLLSIREPPFIPSSVTSLSLSRARSHFISAALLWKLMNCRDWPIPICSAGDLCVERKDFGANIPEIKS